MNAANLMNVRKITRADKEKRTKTMPQQSGMRAYDSCDGLYNYEYQYERDILFANSTSYISVLTQCLQPQQERWETGPAEVGASPSADIPTHLHTEMPLSTDNGRPWQGSTVDGRRIIQRSGLQPQCLQPGTWKGKINKVNFISCRFYNWTKQYSPQNSNKRHTLEAIKLLITQM